MAQRLDNARIVIVDDHDLVRTSLAKFLSQLGAGVRTCANADKAFTQVIHFQLDLVLSDISMPGKDGFELLQEIRTLRRSRGGEVPVVAISGMSRPLDRARAPSAGFDALLLKPFTADDLLQVIDNVIRSGR
ncbi:MAG: hypothetical protein QOH31_1974 [Verrucomicrobiota bacterium]